jgi:hypothetical protein
MQAYALARPAVRFRLHVLKAKNNKGDFMYAPKATSNVEDAVFKVIGKDCALQCDWTALESDGFEIQAFLPKPTANASKIAKQGAFISIDSRPVSNNRGTMKRIVAAFKERLRKSNHLLATVKEPFFSMNITCPPDGYDPNIEPAKDDVMFDNSEVVLGAVDKLLRLYYPEAMIGAEMEPPTSAQRPYEHEEEGAQPAPNSFHSEKTIPHTTMDEEPTPELRSTQPRWRASMYGIDEEDLGYLQESQGPVIEEEEEGRRAAEVSNPWTIARMNAIIKPTNTSFNGQLLSPATSPSDGRILPNPPAVQSTPHKVSHTQPLTPQTTLRVSVPTLNRPRRPLQNRRLHDSTQVSSAPSRSRRKQHISNDEPLNDPEKGPDDTWFGQPMRGSQNMQPHSRSKRRPNQSTTVFPSDTSSRSLFPAADQSIHNDLSSARNTDIRSFLTRTGGHGVVKGVGVEHRPSFTPNNRPPQIGFTPVDMTGTRGRPSSQPSVLRAISYKPLSRSQDNINASPRRSNNQAIIQSSSAANDFTIYEDTFSSPSSPRPSSAGSQHPSLMPTSPNKPSQNSRDMAACFKQYQDRETASVDRFSSPTRRLQPRIPPPYELTTRSRPQRRRTTDQAQRTKSSQLPLERIPHRHHIQEVVLAVHISIASMIQTSRKLNMRRNSIEWGYTVDEASYDAFAEPVTAKTVMAWVLQLDVMLFERCEELPGADVRSMLHEAIQRGLDERKDAVVEIESGIDEIGGTVNHVRTAPEHGMVVKIEDDVDKKKFVEFEVQMIEDDELRSSVSGEEEIRKVDEDKTRKVDEEFGDDIDDDMLLDM